MILTLLQIEVLAAAVSQDFNNFFFMMMWQLHVVSPEQLP